MTAMAKPANEMTIKELKELLKTKKEQAATAWKAEGYKLKQKIDAYVLKTYGKQLTEWGVKPADVYLCANPDRKIKKGDRFRNPKTGEEWTYKGKGTVKDWVTGHEDEYKIGGPPPAEEMLQAAE